MSYDIVVEKSTGRLGIKIAEHPFDSKLVDILTKAATETSMAELTCDFKSNWEPFKTANINTKWRWKLSRKQMIKKYQPIKYSLENNREEMEKFLRGNAI